MATHPDWSVPTDLIATPSMPKAHDDLRHLGATLIAAAGLVWYWFQRGADPGPLHRLNPQTTIEQNARMIDDSQPTWDDTLTDSTKQVSQEVPPRLIPDGFRCGVLLGKGSQSRVYALEPDGDGPRLALKVVPGDAGPQQARFDREVQLLERVRHPHLVRLRGVRHDAKASGLIMDRIDGRPLQEWLSVSTPPPAAGPVPTVVETATCMRRGPCRDLKPGNVRDKRTMTACPMPA